MEAIGVALAILVILALLAVIGAVILYLGGVVYGIVLLFKDLRDWYPYLIKFVEKTPSALRRG